MKIAVIQASTRAEINQLLFDITSDVVGCEHEVVNLGVFTTETENYSYVDIAVMISLLVESGAVDFVVTGCSSGQGMMMACNSLPGLRCGFVQTPQDAYLFGRINSGNVVSLPLGLNYGWSGELNLRYTLEKLFDGEFGVGYPAGDANRKRQETQELLKLNQLTKRSFSDILDKFDKSTMTKVMKRTVFREFLYGNGTNIDLLGKLNAYEV